MSELVVVICTYDNPAMLVRVLAALGRQTADGGRWSVLVVNNNSGTETQQVLAQDLVRAAVPGLQVVDEPTQGLTPARLRGVRETTAPWIAFVDDDCIVDDVWIEEALAFIDAHPECGGFGGRVTPTYVEEPPEVLKDRGWAFAEQDLGDDVVAVDCLVGAGMVLNRAALDESGWSAAPFFADRVGQKLVSGGDVEIALRVAGTGRLLWYVPGCRLQHIIPARRTTMQYLVRMTKGLGVSFSLAQALTWRGSRAKWAVTASEDAARSLVPVAMSAQRALRRRIGWPDLVLMVSYEWGRWVGMARIAGLLVRGRCAFFGRDRVVRAR